MRRMLAEILTIGDEICRGEIVDTNSAYLAAQLWDLDITVAWLTSCRDVAADIKAAVNTASGRADVVLGSGGLGPTEDDLTVDVVSELVGVEPEIHTPSLERMKTRFAAASFRLTPNNLRQVRAPGGARVFANPEGLAPGFEVSVNGVPCFFGPGVPRELEAIFETGITARLVEIAEQRAGQRERLARRVYRVFGRGESHVAARLEGVVAGVAGASIHYQVKFPETLVKVVVRDADAVAAQKRLDAVDEEIRARLGRSLYGIDDDSLAAALGRALSAAGATLATAESCTAGQVGTLITSVAGSSGYYLGGAITYSNEEKTRQLGVSAQTIESDGAVSEQVVKEMATGAKQRFGSSYAVAVSGVAGPGGGTPQKPVGTVWIAVAGPDGFDTKHLAWPGRRDQIRTLASFWALAMVLRALAAAQK